MTQLVNQNQTQAPLERRHRFTVQEFEQMSRASVFYGRKVELLDGEIIDMNANGDGHSTWTGSLTERLVLSFHGKARVIPQQTVRLIEDFYMPMPVVSSFYPRHNRSRPRQCGWC